MTLRAISCNDRSAVVGFPQRLTRVDYTLPRIKKSEVYFRAYTISRAHFNH